MNRKFYVLFLVLALFSATALNAAVITFTGGGDGTTWEDPANWDTGTVPGFGDDVFIDGTSAVTLSSFASINSLRVLDSGGLNIMVAGVLTVNEQVPVGDAIQIFNAGVILVNGSLVVLNSPSNGIEIFDIGTLVNYGFVNIVGSGSEGIFIWESADIDNHNIMFIQGGTGDALDMEDTADFNNYGTLNIDNYDTEGIDMDDDAKFINDGTVNITNGDDNDAVDIDDSDTYFENNGALNISVVINRGEGLEVDDGLFHNTSTGTVMMMGVTGDGLYIQSGGEVINDGSINIEITPGASSDNAVELESSGYLENNNLINIWNNGSTDAIELEASTSELNNTLCGVINILTANQIQIQSAGGLFTNDGVVATVFGGTNDNDGTFVNNGQINAPNGFTMTPNAPVGGGTIDMSGAVPAQSACNINIGSLGCGGNTTYNAAQDTYTQTANGCYYVGGYATDEISYAFQELCGNGEIIARVASFVGQGWGGVMMREDLSPASRKVSLMMNQSQVARREVRVSPGGPAFPQQFPAFGYSWVRLVRNGNYFQGYISQNGFNWQFVMNQYVPMQNCIHIGLVSTNYNQFNSTSTVIFDNVFFSTVPLATPDVPGVDIAFEEVTEENISVYPNPTNGKITIEVNSSLDEVMDIRVINSLGQSVKSLSLNPTESFREEVDLSGLPSGMYNVHFQKANGETQIERVVLNSNN